MSLKHSTAAFFPVALVVFAVTWYLFQNKPTATLRRGNAVFESTNKDDPLMYEFLVEGGDIFIDENKDGKPQTDEEIEKGEQLPFGNSDTGTKYQIKQVDLGVAPKLVSNDLKQKLILYVDIGNENTYTMTGKIELNEISSEPNWLHFGGPLQFLELEKMSLKHSQEPVELRLFLGTVANGTFPDGVQNVDQKDSGMTPPFRTTIVIPQTKAPFPLAEIRFEIENSDPITRQVLMDQFC